MNQIVRNTTTGMLLLILAGSGLAQKQPRPMLKPVPSAGGTQDENAKDPQVEKLKAEAAKLEAQLKKKPKDAKLKEKTAEAYYTAGHAMMVSKVLMPKVKYRGALKLFRKCLSLDPSDKKAAEEKKMIEDIYKQMGRPIPQ